MSAPDVIVVGGGPAGSAAAAWLADAGARVVLVERTAGAHDKVCGEFVGADALALLHDLGVDPAGLGAVPVERLRLLHGARTAEAPLPFPAASLSRRILDEHLLDIARDRGATVRRGVAVRAAETGPGGVRVALADQSVLTAGALFLATGKHDLRGHGRGPGVQNGLIGFKMHLELPAAQAAVLERAVELMLFDGGYAGLQPVGGGLANLCLLVTRRAYAAAGGSWPRLLERLADGAWAERLAGARPCWPRPLSVYGLPYGYVAGAEAGPLFRLGDQMAVIPSFAGDGIAIALRSARMAVDALMAGGADAHGYHRAAAGRFGTGVRAAAWASRALEHPLLQGVAVEAARTMPGALAWAAGSMRLGGGCVHRNMQACS